MVNTLHKEDVTLNVSVEVGNYSYVIFEWKRCGLLTSKQIKKGSVMVETEFNGRSSHQGIYIRILLYSGQEHVS